KAEVRDSAGSTRWTTGKCGSVRISSARRTSRAAVRDDGQSVLEDRDLSRAPWIRDSGEYPKRCSGSRWGLRMRGHDSPTSGEVNTGLTVPCVPPSIA